MIEGNVVLALASAVAWGGGDFAGGMGVKTIGGSVAGALRVVLLSHLTSFLLLLIAAAALGSPFPHGATLGWGLASGVAGGLALTAFYIALSRGAMGAPAAISGLLAAAIPAMVGLHGDGSPGLLKLGGFAVAAAAIWLIAAGEGKSKRGVMALAVGAGAGFGLYFVALKMAGAAGPVWAMGAARIASLATCSLMLLMLPGPTRRLHTPPKLLRWVLLTAMLDTCGNMLFVAATQRGRLDVAAVLASMYPATTILLAAWTLKERPSQRQGLGMLVAAGAVMMITL